MKNTIILITMIFATALSVAAECSDSDKQALAALEAPANADVRAREFDDARMALVVALPTEPLHVKRLGVVIVVCFALRAAAVGAGLLLQRPGAYG